jgi:osmotically-inducible protein OsmY
MSPSQSAKRISDESSGCEERRQLTGPGEAHSRGRKTDAGIKAGVERALRGEEVLRGLDFYKVGVRVKNGVVYLNGHTRDINSLGRIENAIRAVPGILKIKNNLVLDDKLTPQAAFLQSGPQRSSAPVFVEQSLREELLANDSLGG